MQIARVVRKIVSTAKNEAFIGRPLLLVQPLDMSLKDSGAEVLCIDFMGADLEEIVLFMKEGSSINQLLGTKKAPADAGIIGIVDTVTVHEKIVFDKSSALAKAN